MHLPLASLVLHSVLTYLIGLVLLMLGMFPVMGFGFGTRAVVQRLGLATRAVGDDNLQIAIDFTGAFVGLLFILGIIRWFRRPLWRLIRGDLRLLRLITRAIARPFRKRTTSPIAVGPIG